MGGSRRRLSWTIRDRLPRRLSRRALGRRSERLHLVGQGAWCSPIGGTSPALRCLIFVGAGDADFLDQAREAVDDIP
jgi:hypothetical protein